MGVAIKHKRSEGLAPQVSVYVSTYQGSIVEFRLFEPQPNYPSNLHTRDMGRVLHVTAAQHGCGYV